jgi:hypothetical protein
MYVLLEVRKRVFIHIGTLKMYITLFDCDPKLLTRTKFVYVDKLV